MNTQPKLTDEQIEDIFQESAGPDDIVVSRFASAIESAVNQQWLDMLAAAPGVEKIMALHDDAAEYRHVHGSPRYNTVSDQKRQALRTAVEQALAARVPGRIEVTEEMHIAACKVLTRANGLDGLPQRMLDAMLAAAPHPPQQPQLTLETAPLGTKAPSFNGGAWMKTERGWQWNGGTRSPGSTFPRPGGDWDGRLITPHPPQQPASPDLRKAAQAVVERWDSLLWGGNAENLRHTGEYIAELRRALQHMENEQ
jgi:hypothetical protein